MHNKSAVDLASAGRNTSRPLSNGSIKTASDY